LLSWKTQKGSIDRVISQYLAIAEMNGRDSKGFSMDDDSNASVWDENERFVRDLESLIYKFNSIYLSSYY